ncbi:MAG: HyaD/HybD family hydrogenase maturation endopeptidase [Thiothrix sp.]|uniref:HyaD/HybD family hydrogenase maturation endopeptidase n=1 Tax=Thiothrix sp. TaxID=1032 RepID=UPI00261FA7B6|nr:HyaD/HybD family hydrogenase maturation endopeptidase [Thiothrix sp.]MDD5393071.1 HyaD/HybD family hydrogenase maturation endopeptidase [Thiothrix sp.]
MRVLVLGLGNVLMEDEGVGVRAVELLESRYRLPPQVEVIDGGTTGTELLEPMRNVDYLIVADAVNTGAPPGTLVRLTGAEIPAFFQCKLSNHQLGLSDLLAVLTVTGESPKAVTIIGMVPHSLNNTLGLTPATLERLEQMVEMLVAELRRIGVEAELRPAPLPCFWAEQTRSEASACA